MQLTLAAGDAAVTLLKAGADPSKRNKEERLPIELAPDKEVSPPPPASKYAGRQLLIAVIGSPLHRAHG